MKKKNSTSLALALFATVASALQTRAQSTGVVDAAYVANYSSNTVSVIARTTLGVLAAIPVGNNPNKVVASPDARRVLVGNFDVDGVRPEWRLDSA
jgi:YVTN family beta-propeller protein